MTTRTFLFTCGALAGGCTRAMQDEVFDCLHEESARALIDVSTEPDFEIEVPTDAVQSPEPWEDGGKVKIQAWDCLDMAWWNPTPAQKVVQVWVDQTECELYEDIFVEELDCWSHDGSDGPFRDWDEDGVTAWDGDCDDEDPSTGGDLDRDGTRDCVDDDGDDLSEEESDSDDGDPDVQ